MLRKEKRSAYVLMISGIIVIFGSLYVGFDALMASGRMSKGSRSTEAIALRQHRTEELLPTQENIRAIAAAEAKREAWDTEYLRSIIADVGYLLLVVAGVGGLLFISAFKCHRLVRIIERGVSAKDDSGSIQHEEGRRT